MNLVTEKAHAVYKIKSASVRLAEIWAYAQVVETSVIVRNNSSFSELHLPDNQTRQTTYTPGL